MRILILGCDGYIGWAFTSRLLKKGYIVAGIDDGSRRRRVAEIGSDSLTDISSFLDRSNMLKSAYGSNFINWIDVSLGLDQVGYITSVLEAVKPDAIVHLAEQPSAPWSMRGCSEATATQMSNVIGTLHLLWAMREVAPQAHLVKLGTMGEYGTPECVIPEGKIEEGPMKGLMFPRTAGSWYHLSKVHDTHNIEFACRTWGLRSTDIMQGIVYGIEEGTRFDYDQYFGTVINRFCVQALIEHPLTVYGSGNQVRGFLPLKDSLQCLELAILNPPAQGEYRTFNQFEDIYSINDLSNVVAREARSLYLNTSIEHLKNPRAEMEEHYYEPIHQKLFDLGYEPTVDLPFEVRNLLTHLYDHRHKVIKRVINPTTTWR